MSWRGRWAAAQVTPVLFSGFVWLLVCGLAPVSWLAGLAAFAAVLVAARTSRPVLWIRFGVRPATWSERDTVLAALVPVASLRGRSQPGVWVGPGGRGLHAVGPRQLLVSRALLAEIMAGRVDDELVSAAAGFALGQAEPAGSGMVWAVELYCTPWRIVERVVRAVSRSASRLPLAGFGWTIRPVVFALAAVNAYTTGPEFWREVAAACVLVILALTYTTPALRRRWEARLQELGDARVVADGFGAVWAEMVCGATAEPATLRRLERLTRPGARSGQPAGQGRPPAAAGWSSVERAR